jgi:chaperone required for assembly of F1-ATPase
MMRDILSDLEAAEKLMDPNPMRRAQRAMLAPMPKRFYKHAGVVEQGAQFVVVLDGKPVKTPARKPLAFPAKAAAELVAAEFEAQEKEINPANMPFTRLANTAIDGVANEIGAVLEDIQRFSANDLLCYRAEMPDALVQRQAAVWDRYLDWVRAKHGVRLFLAQGVMHVGQPPESVEAFRLALRAHAEPLKLACLHAMTTLTGSAILALAVAEGEASAEEAWKAAHLDEDWTNENWGADSEAEARRAARWQDMRAADLMLRAVSGG